jgi:hypothetical protein
MVASLLLVACEPKAGSERDADARETGVFSAAPSAASASAASPAAAWPPLPRDGVAVGALIEAETRTTPAAALPPLTVDPIVAALRDGVRRSSLATGLRPIAEALGKRIEGAAHRGASVYLMFGSFHDAPGQLDAFRQLVGPLGITPAPLVALEQLQADGAWTGVDGNQAGDDAPLRRYLASGEAGALAELEESQRERNYTAWKYDYVERVTDLVTTVRAAGRELCGCDMPSTLQARVRADLGEEGEVLRDLHCALALRRALAGSPPPHRVAVFVGDAHLAPRRLARFLPADAEILRIHLLGMRGEGTGLEHALGQRLVTLEPVLAPVAETRFVLLLPDARLGLGVDRVRTSEAIDAGDRHQLIFEGFGGTAQVGRERAELSGTTRVSVSPGRVPFFLDAPDRAIAGSVDLPAGGSVTLSREPDGVIRIVSRAPAP